MLNENIDGNTIFDLSASDVGRNFEPGRFSFYNSSQANVRYSGFTVEESKPVSEPAFGLGLGILGGVAFLRFWCRK